MDTNRVSMYTCLLLYLDRRQELFVKIKDFIQNIRTWLREIKNLATYMKLNETKFHLTENLRKEFLSYLGLCSLPITNVE